LELNTDRIEINRIVNTALAYSIAIGETEIPDEWFPLLVATPEEAADLRRSRAAAVLKAKAKAQLS
jgi:hypothetical protein